MRQHTKLTRALFRQGPFLYFTCVCGLGQAVNPALPYCGQCGTEYTIHAFHVVLDAAKKTPRLAVAKAVAKSGGLKIG